MLQNLREQTQGTGFKVLVGFLVVALLFGFGVSGVLGGPDPKIATVGDFDITQNVLALETDREKARLLSRAGPDFDLNSIDTLQLQEYALNQVISRQVMYQTAGDLGVAVSPDVVNDELVNAEAYQVDGQFNEAVYRQQVNMLRYTPAGFVEEFSNALGTQQLQSAIFDSATLPEWELAQIIRVVSQRRDIAFLALRVGDYLDEVEVSDEEIALRYEEEQAAFMTELKVDAQYIEFGIDDLVDDPSVTVSEEDILTTYNAERDQALSSEQRDSSHILISINAERDEAAALELATEISTRLIGGEEFAALAEQFSEDPGSAGNGGSLGAVGKGIFDPAFEDALWALESAGQATGPVLTEFGYHIIQLDEIVASTYPPLEELAEGIESRMRREAAASLFADRALEIERSVYDEGYSLSETATALGLSVANVQSVARSAPPLALNNPAVMDALFSDEVLDGRNSEPVEVDGERVVVVRVENQIQPEPIALEDVSSQIRDTLAREKAISSIERDRAAAFESLESGASAGEVAQQVGGEWRTFELAGRGGSSAIPPEVVERAFAMPRPAAGGKSIASVDLADGSALVTVTRVVQGDINTTTEVEMQELRRLTESRSARFDFQGFFQAAEKELDVNRPARSPAS